MPPTPGQTPTPDDDDRQICARERRADRTAAGSGDQICGITGGSRTDHTAGDGGGSQRGAGYWEESRGQGRGNGCAMRTREALIESLRVTYPKGWGHTAVP